MEADVFELIIIGRKIYLFPCFHVFFIEYSKNKRKRIRKRVNVRMCAYARARETLIQQCFKAHHALIPYVHAKFGELPPFATTSVIRVFLMSLLVRKDMEVIDWLRTLY